VWTRATRIVVWGKNTTYNRQGGVIQPLGSTLTQKETSQPDSSGLARMKGNFVNTIIASDSTAVNRIVAPPPDVSSSPIAQNHPYNTHPHKFGGRKKNSRFVVFDVFEPGTSGGYLADGTAKSTQRAIAMRLIEGAVPHPFAKHVTLLAMGNAGPLYVRGSLEEVTNKLNGLPGPFELTPYEKEVQRMREEGYTLNRRALAFSTTPLKMAETEVLIDRKLEAAKDVRH
jgi:hypothetical protein